MTINAVLIDDAAADSSAFAVGFCIDPKAIIAIGEDVSIVAVESPAWRYGVVPARQCLQPGRVGGEADCKDTVFVLTGIWLDFYFEIETLDPGGYGMICQNCVVIRLRCY